MKNQLLVRDNQWEDKGVFDIARLYRTSDIKYKKINLLHQQTNLKSRL